MPVLVETLSQRSTEFSVCFVETTPSKASINGYPVLSEEEFLTINSSEKFFNIAIADAKIREKLSRKCIENGVRPLAIQALNSVIYDHNQLDEGAVICAYSTITSNVTIGKFFHANLYSYVAHDCVIGDYVTFAPHVHCNGHVHIHDYAYIGTGAMIKQGVADKPLIIGEGAIVGMGAVVTKDVAPYTTVVGNPARLHSKI